MIAYICLAAHIFNQYKRLMEKDNHFLWDSCFLYCLLGETKYLSSQDFNLATKKMSNEGN
jgi:hypothetical protein